MNRPPPRSGGISDAFGIGGNGTEAVPYKRKKSPGSEEPGDFVIFR